MPPRDFADGYINWVEDAPNIFFISGPVMLGIGACVLLLEAERSRRQRESNRRVIGLVVAGMLVAGIVVSYAVVRALHE